ncbi:DNA-primase RepB domain-containing protein [Massilia sp. R2A-15]|uniref:DNA-primase RepB domain-containing protein n=1 Tax=Massilia sp. R2A-15 TaxID=3064278 RepID=UPI0035A73F1B
MNALGHDIGLRPSDPHGLILISNLDRATLVKVRALGLSPAVTLETSPNEYDAWIKLSDTPVTDNIRAAILAGARRHLKLCETGSDINPYGYLAGLTNHTAALRDRGPSRFVIARTAGGAVAESGKKLVDALEVSNGRPVAPPAQERNKLNEPQITGRTAQRERGPSR